MALEHLEALIQPAVLRTSGQEMRKGRMAFTLAKQGPGPEAIQQSLKQVFSIKHFNGHPPIELWSDVMIGLGEPEARQKLTNIYLMGVFYRFDRDGDDQLSHFFLRKMESFSGGLDLWKNDLVFPEDTRKYSVCAVLPKGFEWDVYGRENPHNHAVTQYAWERLASMGVCMEDIIEFMYSDALAKV